MTHLLHTDATEIAWLAQASRCLSHTDHTPWNLVVPGPPAMMDTYDAFACFGAPGHNNASQSRTTTRSPDQRDLRPGLWGQRRQRSPKSVSAEPSKLRVERLKPSSIRVEEFEVFGCDALIKEARIARGWSHKTLKTALKVHLPYVEDIESGKQGVRPWHIPVLNRVFKLAIPEVWQDPQAQAQAALPLSLTQRREEAGLSRQDVSRALGVSSTVIDGWETGYRPVAPRNFSRLGELLGMEFKAKHMVPTYARLLGCQDQVRNARGRLGLSRGDVTRLMGTYETYLGDIERGATGISPEHIPVLNMLLDLDLPVGQLHVAPKRSAITRRT